MYKLSCHEFNGIDPSIIYTYPNNIILGDSSETWMFDLYDEFVEIIDDLIYLKNDLKSRFKINYSTIQLSQLPIKYHEKINMTKEKYYESLKTTIDLRILC